MDYNYNLIFIRYQDEVLLLNREKGFEMGLWNALGGKIEKNETPLESAKREAFEESNYKLDDFKFCGSFTWENLLDKNDFGNIACYYAFVESKIDTPVSTREGILDWKKISWITNPKNVGITEDLKTFIPHMFNDEVLEYHCIYEGSKLIELTIK